MTSFAAWLVFSLSPSAEAKPSCPSASLGSLTAQPAPGILVLGERPGVRKDAAKAKRVIQSLAKRGPVTMGVEFIEARRQSVVDKLSAGRVSLDALPNALAFEDDGHTFSVYRRILALPERIDNLSLVALGQPFLVRPADTAVPMPPGYTMVLTDAMGESPVPPELESRTVQMVAFHDRRLAQTALDSWTGEGWLVLLVDRTWVQGGLGVAWQLQRLTDVPVRSALLANAKSDCYPDDLILR
ncbi:MAG: hypothetical protein AAGA48_22640 [Myxococcota bacterium]